MRKNKIILAGSVVISLCLAHVGFAAQYGIFQTGYVNRDLILETSKNFVAPNIAAPLIEKYILGINPDRDETSPNDISTKDLSKRIAGVSYCFHIDPFVFASLIHEESINYNQHAKSPTGAKGFTQFTTIAIQEVNDQLGARGKRYAQTDATDYFNSVLSDDCLEKFGEFKSTGKNYQALWELGSAASLKKGSSAQAKQMATMMTSYPEYALIYGAILLKVNFSLVESGYKTGCYTYKTGHPVSMTDKFKEVMMMYNGDGCAVQKEYQSKILASYYPTIMDEEKF